MASGCMPSKKDRDEAFKRSRETLRAALDILDGLPSPDADPRMMEHAIGLITDSMGKRNGVYIDTDQEDGWTDLIEHYFS